MGEESESESCMCGGVGRSREKWYVRDVMCLLRKCEGAEHLDRSTETRTRGTNLLE